MLKHFSTPLCSLLFLLAGLIWNVPGMQAQAVTFSYNFDGQVLTGTSTQPASAVANNATYGPGLTGATFYTGNPGDAMAGAGFTSGTPLNPANNDYFGFSLTTIGCNSATITGISFDARRSGTGPGNLELRSSADNYTAALYAGTMSGTNFESKSGTFSVTIAAGQTLSFRLYGYNASAAAGTLRIDNVTFNGNIVSASPAAYTVTNGGAICPPAGAVVGLSGSQLNVSYQLRLNNANQGSALIGTGAALNFGSQTSFGTYTVVATGSGGCTRTQTGSVTISQSSNCGGGECNLSLSTTQVNVLCNGGASGSIDLTPANGTEPYTYDWSNDGEETPDNDTQDLSGLTAGTYTVTVSDAAGCMQSTSVVISQPNALSLNSTHVNPSSCAASNGSIDLTVSGGTSPYTYDWSNDGPETPDNDPQDLNGLNAGTYTVTVTDANGCTAVNSATLESSDVTPPSIVCPANATVSVGANCSAVLLAYEPQSLSDNCTANPALSQNPAAGTILDASNPSRTVILTATDNAGNTAVCSFTVSLSDQTQPTLVCPADQTVNASAACAGTVGSWNAVSVEDNCSSGVVVNQSPASTTALNGHNDFRTVTLTATDNSGNSQSCSFTVTLKDVTSPSITCPPNVSINPEANCSAAIGAYLPRGLSDNCTANPVITQEPLATNLVSGQNTGTIVTLTATDDAGNTQSCTLTVTLKDATAPVLVCKDFTADLNAAGSVRLFVENVYQSGSDNCGSVNVKGPMPDYLYCNNIGSNLVTILGIDESGNTSTCQSTVTVRDAIAPVARCKNTSVSLGVGGIATLATSAINNGSSDNCSFQLSITPATLDCANVGINTVTLQATDAGGNTSTCSAQVTVSDLSGPTAKCKNATIFLDNQGEATLSVADVNNGSNDACGIANMSLSRTQFNCSELPGSAWPVTLSMNDMHGNTSSCLAYVTVKDAIAPTSVCENVTVRLASNGKVTVYGAELAPKSFDNCSVWSFTPAAKVYTTANLGDNNLTITAKDWSGNGSTCVSVVTVLPYSTGDFHQNTFDHKTADKIGTDVLSLYPNPNNGQMTISFELPAAQEVTMQVFDLQGRMISNINVQGVEGFNTLPLQLEAMAPGMYVLGFHSADLKTNKRFVVQD